MEFTRYQIILKEKNNFGSIHWSNIRTSTLRRSVAALTLIESFTNRIATLQTLPSLLPPVSFRIQMDTQEKKTAELTSGSKRRLSSGPSSSKRGRKNRLRPHLRKVNEERSRAKADKDRVKTFKRWKLHTQALFTGSGKHMRKAAKSILILFLLSQFIVLSEKHQFDDAHRATVFKKMAEGYSQNENLFVRGRDGV